MVSQFHVHSIGIVAENKPRNDRFCNIIAIEDSPALDGEVSYNPQTEVIQITDSVGKVTSIKTTSDATINCEWYPSGSNRVTPPDVQRGELVEILRLADTDQYYWRCMGLRDNLRRLETVIFAVNASPENGGSNGINFKNCYFFEVSGHNGQITLGTSKANGEPFSYTMQLNTKEGAFNLIDDIGNQFELDSGDRRLQMRNADNSYVKVEKKTVEISGDDSVKLMSGGTSFELTPKGSTHTTPDYAIV